VCYALSISNRGSWRLSRRTACESETPDEDAKIRENPKLIRPYLPESQIIHTLPATLNP